MSHLHIPDGLLPLWIWLPGLIIAVVLLVVGARTTHPSPQRIAYQGALGGLMLAAMVLPIGPLEYHLTLAGPIGVLLGAAGGFQAAFIVSAILALMGHGGLTVVGLNALVLGSCAATAAGTYRALGGRLRAPVRLAVSTGAGQAVAGLAWLGLVALSLRVAPGLMPAWETGPHRMGWFMAVAVPMWFVGIAVESMVAWGIGRFLERVRPGLLAAEAPPARGA
jgi:cobalt/nickel transport system permease protein